MKTAQTVRMYSWPVPELADRRRYSTRDLAEALGETVANVRFWADAARLPRQRRGSRNQRRFSRNEALRLAAIGGLRRGYGLPLKEAVAIVRDLDAEVLEGGEG